MMMFRFSKRRKEKEKDVLRSKVHSAMEKEKKKKGMAFLVLAISAL